MRALALLFCALMAHAADLYVSPRGNDRWTGKLKEPNEVRGDGPLATLAAARDRLRGTAGPNRIFVRGGEYFLTEPLVLTAADSGLAIEAAPGEAPVLYGGRRVTGWERDGERFWSARVPEFAGKPWDFRLLIVNGRFCQPARLPAEGTFTHESEFKVRWMTTTGGGWQRKPTEEELTNLRFRAGDLPDTLDAANAELTVYHMWDESLVRVASIDRASRIIRFASQAGHPAGAFGVQKYVVWNVREGMTKPGQWYLDHRAGKVVYWPLDGERMDIAVAFAPTAESIIRLEGTKAAPVERIALAGLRLSLTNTPPVAGGFGAGRYDGAIAAANANGCTFRDLAIFNVGGQGIKAQGANGLRILNSEVRDTGAGGIIARGDDIEIADNHVHHSGLSYPSAIGVYCGGNNIRIVHNEVHDTPYTAVNCGGSGHLIEGNLIYRAMTVLHDGAAFYTIFGKGIVVRGNLVRDIPDTGGYGSSAYYLDEQSKDCIVEKNVSIGVARPSHNHMANGNTIRNNVFLYAGDTKITFPRSTAFQFEKNVIWAKGKITIENPKAITGAKANLFYTATGTVEGAPQDTLLADPQFIIRQGADYGFAEGSPARRLEIEPVDVTTAGRRTAPGVQ